MEEKNMKEKIIKDKKIIVQFTVLTFCIAYLVSGTLIVLGHFGYSVCNLYFVARDCFIYRSEEK